MEGVKCLWSHTHTLGRKRDVGRKEMRRNECACLCELQLEAEGGEEGFTGSTEKKCACGRVCMEEIRLQSIKDIEPTAHQMTFETPFREQATST